MVVHVADANGKIVATRSMLVRPMSRCFCMWLCVCSCIGSFAVVDTSDLCKEMSYAEANQAGFQSDNYVEQRTEVFNWIAILPLTMLVLGFLIVLGNFILVLSFRLKFVEYNRLQEKVIW